MKELLKNNLFSAIICGLFLSTWAIASTISRTYTFTGGSKAIATQVNAEFDNVINFLNNGNVGPTNIAASGVATPNIASFAVTKAKLDTATLTVTGNSSNFNSVAPGTNGIAAVTNLSTTITTTGRPVRVSMSVGAYTLSGNSSTLGFVNSNTTTSNILFLRDSVTTSIHPIVIQTSGATPCSAYSFVESPGAGSHTYSVSVKAVGSPSAYVNVFGCTLVVEEL